MEDSGVRSQVAGRLQDDHLLAGFVPPFRRLAGPGEADLGRSFDQFGQVASRSDLTARVVFRVAGNAGTAFRAWSLELTPGAYQVSTEAVHRPDLEVLVSEATWRQLAEGSLSPLLAFATGELRVRGDIRLAGRLARLMHGE